MRPTSGLRICIAATGLGHVTRGVESWADDLGNALARRGEQVTLCKGAGEPNNDFEQVIPCWTRTSRRTDQVLRYLPHAIGWRIGLGSAYGVEQSTFAANLVRFLRRSKIDVLHVQDPQLAVWVQHAHRIGLCPTQTILGHGTQEPSDWLDRITYLHHIAPWHEEQVAAEGITKATWTMIPNFIDTKKFQPGNHSELRNQLSIPSDASVALVSSAIKRGHKRVDHLIDEVALVRKRRVDLPLYLVIAGGRENDTQELVQMAKTKLGDRVRFLINHPRDRMPDLYRMADLLLHGSEFEMFGTVLLEATATGIPCIVHHHPVMKWVVGPGGLALDLSVPGNLTTAMIRLLDDKTLSDQMGAAAREHCCKNFCQKVVVNQMLDYYQRVVGRDRVAA